MCARLLLCSVEKFCFNAVIALQDVLFFVCGQKKNWKANYWNAAFYRSLLEIVTEIQLSTMRWLRQSMHVIFDFNQSNGLITYLWEWKCTAAFKVVNLTSIYRITAWISIDFKDEQSFNWPSHKEEPLKSFTHLYFYYYF